MADFRTKFFTLASVATMFAGMAHAQVNQIACTAASGAVFVAAESTTEQVADTTITCAASGNGATATTVNLSVYLSPAVTITSATVGSGGGAVNESEAGIGAAGAPFATLAAQPFGAGTFTEAPVNGTVSGSSVTFNGIKIPNNAPVTFTITNIKVNASQVASSGGAPTAITETIFIGGTNVTPGVLPAVNVAFVTNGLASVKTTQSSGNSIGNIQICSGVNAYGGPTSQDTKLTVGGVTGAVGNLDGNAAFNVQFSEGFATAFKDKGTSAGNANLGSEFTANTYTGYGVAAGGGTNTATSGTRVQVVFNNIPTGVTVYVPLTILESSGAAGLGGATKMVLVTSATGAQNLATGSTANGAPGATAGNNGGDSSAAALSVSNGSATAVYEEVNNSTGVVETFQVPVMLSAGGAAVTAPSSAITATVSFGPIGSSSSVPNYVSGTSTASPSGAAFSACTTTLLFPFVTNQLGFDTGIAIANTSTDILKNGTSTSNAAAQSGTCQLSFFGNTAPAAVTTANIASGSDYAAAASSVAPGFQGYMIANCNFLYAHGFAYVVYNLTQNNGAAMGYLANVIENDRKSVVAETVGVGTTNPESAGQ